MRKKRRKFTDIEGLSKKIVKYYFENPHANSSKHMEEKFNVSKTLIRNILSDELKKRSKSEDNKVKWYKNY
tara:strand:+ start:43 stop:255 length:213 start_codon:yes stop_codon:yes gene_type:complete